jgi:hypothetical protein
MDSIQNYIPTKIVQRNMQIYITDSYIHKNCIWFRNNGDVWHTLFSFDKAFRMLKFNGKKYGMFFPELVFHVGKNTLGKYEVDIFFKNAFCRLEEKIDSFMKIDSDNLKIKKQNKGYIAESIEIINYIFNDYDFDYPHIEDLIDANKYNAIFDELPVSKITLNDLIMDWKKEVDNSIDENLIYKSMISPYKHNYDKYDIDTSNKLYKLANIIFQTGKTIKLKGNKYTIIDIQNEELSTALMHKFENDKIILYDVNKQKQMTLPTKQIADKIVKKYVNSEITEIEGTELKIGNYLQQDGHFWLVTALKYTNYAIDVEFELPTVKKKTTTKQYNIFKDNNHLLPHITDIHTILENEANRETQYNHFTVQSREFECVTIDVKKSSKKYKLDELFQLFSTFDIYDKILNKKMEYNQYYYSRILKYLSQNNLNENRKKDSIATYLYIYPRNDLTDNLNMENTNLRNIVLLHSKNCLDYDFDNRILYIKKRNDDFNINNHVATKISLPCKVNNMVLKKNNKYLSLEYNSNHGKILTLQKINYDKNDIQMQFIDEENKLHDITWGGIYSYTFKNSYQELIEPFDGLEIGYWGKLTKLRSIHGFKKNMKYQIVAFHNSFNNSNNKQQQMVRFNNGISVIRSLVVASDFKQNPTGKNLNNVYFDRIQLCRFANSKKFIRKFVSTGACVACEITSID